MTRRQFAAFTLAAASVRGQKRPLRRSDSFFGLHFDLHPQMTDKELGADLTPEMVDRFLSLVKPDYVQYDCKGHPGVLGYPSKVGPSSPGIIKDSLRIWRDGTKKHGVGLYIHFSGVWDTEAVKSHPEWARVGPKGEVDKDKTSTFGPYVDQRMIPQLAEASGNYELDGAWVDGECWAVALDYSPAAVAAWTRASGRKTAPRSKEEPGWSEWIEFQREQFRTYVRHYIDVLHRQRPGLQIASNWMYTTYVPEKPSIPLDFISGDYLGNASISAARLQSRYLSATGVPWDLMAWGFQSAGGNAVGHIHKSAVQLQQEASIVLAQGGGFQIYYVPTRAGRLNDGHIQVMHEVGSFCRARQAICHKSESIADVAILYSGHSLYATTDKMFGGWGKADAMARGFLDALVATHIATDVIPDWKLPEVARRYKLIVVPDWPDIGSDAQSAIEAYVSAGGTALIAGAENGTRFAEALGVTPGAAKDTGAYVDTHPMMANVRSVWLSVKVKDAEVLAQRYPTYDTSKPAEVAATRRSLGKGTVAAIYGGIGGVHAAVHDPWSREFISSIVARLYQPSLVVEAPPTVEVVLGKKNGKRYVHLINTTGMQVAGDYAAMDFIPAVGPVRLKAGAWRHEVPQLHIHEAVEWPL